MAFRTGVWPERLVDVRETEDILSDADLETVSSFARDNNK